MSALVPEVRRLLDQAAEAFSDQAAEEAVRSLVRRLDEPLRVAIAGKVKAGKSTLLNALVGEKLAPTDTGECTRIVTWYRDGHTYQVLLHGRDGSDPVQVPFTRHDGAIEIDLGGRSAADVEQLDVMWPSGGLRAMTLVDTPGVGSLDEDAATRVFDFLDPDRDDAPADAVLYLMRHIHASDLRLLEGFHDTTVALPDPVNAVGVLSRADEVGAGRVDALGSARRIAARYGDDPRLRRLVQTVVPVAGLVAETARTLTEWEYQALCELAAVPAKELEPVLLSADRFVEARPETPLTSLERERLLDRFGMFGVRLALALLRRNVVSTSQELADELVARSGLEDLRGILGTLFMERADVLRARSALLALDRLCAENAHLPAAAPLRSEVERIIASAHPFQELTTLAALRSGWVEARTADRDELERLLGGRGTTPGQRLGLDGSPTGPEVRRAATEALARWQRTAENPFSSRDLVLASRVAMRTLEELLTRPG